MALRVYRGSDDQSQRPIPPRRRNQFTLRTLLVITTVLSVFFAGFGQYGISGALGTLLSSWLVILGVAIIWSTYRQRKKGWLLAGISGAIVISLGALGMFFVVHSEHRPLAFGSLFASWDIVTVLLGLAIGFVIWDVFRTKWTTVIVVGPEGIRRQRGIAKQKVDAIHDFVRRMKMPGVVKIRSKKNAHGHLVLRCDGHMSPVERQRLRNFLVDTL